MEHPIIRNITVFALVALLVGCYYDNEEELYPATTCDTATVTYSTDVVSILTNNQCIACHNNTSPSGGIDLDNHADLKISVDNGKLMGSINHSSGFSPMPQGSASKINQCSIDKLQAWVAAGAPNN
jgi:hypothetical protein